MPRRKDRKQLNITVTSEFYTAVQQAAKKAKMSIADYVRGSVGEALFNDRIEYDKDYSFKYGNIDR